MVEVNQPKPVDSNFSQRFFIFIFFFFWFDLFGQLLLTQLVQREELARQLHVVDEATTGQLDPDDDLAVGDHHGHAAEVDLQVLGQLLATCVTWILDDREN